MKLSPAISSKILTRGTIVVSVMAVIAVSTYGAFRQPMELYEQRIISGDINDIWHVATDVARWPEWDPHEEAGEIYGPFAVGTKAFSKPRGGPSANWQLTEVTVGKSWALINPMPIGTLRVQNLYSQTDDGKVLCEKTMQVSGWVLVALFKLHFATKTREDMQATWIALENRVATP